MIENGVMRRVVASLEFASAFPRDGTVIIVAEALANFLIERRRHGSIAVFLGEAAAPVERRGNFVRVRIQPDLLFKSILRVRSAALAQAEPGCLPVGIRRAWPLGK